MLDIKFLGGLGNQMFVYALYIQLRSLFPEVKFHFDVDSYKYERFHHGFQLHKVFILPEEFWIKDEYSSLEQMWYKFITNVKRYWFVWIRKDALLRDDGSFATKLKQIKRDRYYYVRGTWISDNYFSSVQKEVRNAFSFRKDILSQRVHERVAIMKKQEANLISVALHVRRGDYTNSDFVSLAETDYYQLALKNIGERESVKSLKLYLFSDDVNWCVVHMQFLKKYNVEYVDGQKDFEDMYLMTKCDYVITANSTFSWWGGFLSNAKCVFAPRQIHRNKDLSNDELDFMYPNTWTLI